METYVAISLFVFLSEVSFNFFLMFKGYFIMQSSFHVWEKFLQFFWCSQHG